MRPRPRHPARLLVGSPTQPAPACDGGTERAGPNTLSRSRRRTLGAFRNWLTLTNPARTLTHQGRQLRARIADSEVDPALTLC